MDDDELTRLLHGAFPAASDRIVRPAQVQVREQIVTARVSERPATVPARTHHWWGMPASLAASVAIVLIAAVTIGVVFLRAPVAVAATPPALEVTPITRSAPSMLHDLANAVRDQEAGAQPTIRFQQWALVFDGEAGQPPQQVSPEIFEVRPAPDGGVTIEVRAADTTDATGQRVENPQTPAGTLLWSLQTPPDDLVRMFADDPPVDSDEVSDYFMNAGLVAAGSSGEYFQAIKELLRERSLTSTQTAALVEFLATLPDISVTGETLDRLGRAGVVFTADTPFLPDHRDQLVLSPEHGFLAFEWTYIGTQRTDLHSPAVLEYTVWFTQGELP